MTAELNINFKFSKFEQILIDESTLSREDLEKFKNQVLIFNKRKAMPVCLILVKENKINKAQTAKVLGSNFVYEALVQLLKNDKDIENQTFLPLIKKNKSAPVLLSELVKNNLISENKKKTAFK